MKLLNYVVGFRSNNSIKKLISSLYYFVFLIVLFFSFPVGLIFLSLPFVAFGFFDALKSAFKKETMKKPLLTVYLPLAIFVISLILLGSGSNPEKTKNVNEEVTNENVTKISEEKETELTTDELLEVKIKEVFGEKTNADKKVFISIEDGTEEERAKYININANENLTNNMTVDKMVYDAVKFFEVVANSEKLSSEIDTICILQYLTLVDKYGNESEEAVNSISIKIDTLKKINFKNFLPKNIEDLADIYFVHPCLRD